jgi:hypothetical protein
MVDGMSGLTGERYHGDGVQGKQTEQVSAHLRRLIEAGIVA